MNQSKNINDDPYSINIPTEGQYLIRPSSPCPKCRGLLIHKDTINYICSNCKTYFNLIGHGIMDDELLYEEIINENK